MELRRASGGTVAPRAAAWRGDWARGGRGGVWVRRGGRAGRRGGGGAGRAAARGGRGGGGGGGGGGAPRGRSLGPRGLRGGFSGRRGWLASLCAFLLRV